MSISDDERHWIQPLEKSIRRVVEFSLEMINRDIRKPGVWQ